MDHDEKKVSDNKDDKNDREQSGKKIWRHDEIVSV
jgi:hypothetical protein